MCYSSFCFMQEKKELMLMAWKFLVENVFPPAYIANSPVTPKSGGQFASLCVNSGVVLDLGAEVRAYSLAVLSIAMDTELCSQILC